MRLHDKVERLPSGIFRLKVFRRGLLIEEVEEPNLVVNGYAAVNASLLGGQVTNNSITSIGFGTNATAPAAGNTGLTGAFVVALSSVSYPASGQVQFNFALGSTQATGLAISEFGLLTGAGVLYARKTRSAPLNMNTDISLSGSWTLQC